MAGTFSDAMSQSERDFKALILPIFKKLWRNCDFVQTESKSDELSKALDCYSGVDIVRIDHTKKITTGIASRIQRSDNRHSPVFRAVLKFILRVNAAV